MEEIKGENISDAVWAQDLKKQSILLNAIEVMNCAVAQLGIGYDQLVEKAIKYRKGKEHTQWLKLKEKLLAHPFNFIDQCLIPAGDDVSECINKGVNPNV